jgi:glycosyltransferase involved in cell wall biosynthesis
LVSNTPKITVLMSVYNGAKFLAEAIDSILAQTFTDFEFIIINDASSDDSLHIINSYKDARIVLIQNTKNIGLTKSLNIGIAKAKGKYVARMDADDISMPKRLEKQFGFMEEHLEFAFCGTTAKTINDVGKEISFFKPPTDSSKILALLLFKNCFFHSSLIIRTEKLLQVLGYNETYKYAQDYKLYLELFKNKCYGINLKEQLLVYRVLNSNISHNNKDKQDDLACSAIKTAWQECYGISVNTQFIKKIRSAIIYREQLGQINTVEAIIYLRSLYKQFQKQFNHNSVALKEMRTLVNLVTGVFYNNKKAKLIKRIVYFNTGFHAFN